MTIKANNMATNFGWQFYRNYYSEEVLALEKVKEAKDRGKTLEVRENLGEYKFSTLPPPNTKVEKEKDIQAAFFKKKTEVFTRSNGSNLQSNLFSYSGCKSFNLYTTYPGLIIGTGYAHQTGMQGEMKLGLSFDHTTGLPTIPGSSVKGMLRSFFPHFKTKEENGNPFAINTDDVHYSLKHSKASYIRFLLNKTEDRWPDTSVHQLELIMFEGIDIDKSKQENKKVYLPMVKHDVFHDAFISSVGTYGIFATDFIAPHGDNPLKNPTPIGFLKIAPEVGFQFNFDFKANTNMISNEDKETICKKILMENGIGAKTNVGYGQLESKK
jgi:CRISPR-associated protein Cmr6